MGLLDAPTRNVGGIENHLYNITPSSFRKWNKALAKVRLGSADAKILFVGDSNTCAYGTSDAGRTTKNGHPAVLSRMMAEVGLPAVEGLIAPQVNVNVLNNQIAFTGTWNSGGNQDYLGWASLSTGVRGFWTCSADAATLTFTPGINCDRFDVYYFAFTTSGTATVQATGGSSSNITAGGSVVSLAPISKMTVNAGSVSSSNTLTITKTGTTAIYILGVEAWNSTKKQIRIANAGEANGRAQAWAGSNAAYPGAKPGKCIEAYAPDLTIIGLGTNDAIFSRTKSQLVADIQTIAASAQVSGDVLVVSSWPYGAGNSTVSGLVTSYAQGLRSAGLPYFDINSRMGAYSAYNTAGYMYGDGLHGNDYSHHEYAGWLFNLLRRI